MVACTFFGHRDCSETIKPRLREVLLDLITNHGVDMFYVGHQGQFDAYVHSELVASHLQCRVSHDLLKGERIAAAVHQILPSKGVPESMDRSPLHASVGVVLHDSKPQSVLCQETAELITEQVIRRFTLPNCHVIPQNGHHRSTEGNDLNLAILCMPENNLLSAQVYILILNVADCGSPTTAVQKEVHDDPIPILAELTIGFRLLQERHEFIVGVGFLHSFGSLVDFEIGFCVALFVTPREEDLQGSSVTVD